MQTISYELTKNNAINRWWLSPVFKSPFESPTKAFDADINLGEGYVQIIYPVREEFLSKQIIKSVTPYQGAYNNLYFPFENNRVEFSDFIYTPHTLACYATSDIYAEEDMQSEFEICTCGGIKIWLNDEEIICFAPYTRNIQSKMDILLPLKMGKNKVVVYFDELAERDVFFYFELKYKGEKALICSVDIDAESSIIKRNEEILRSCYLVNDIFDSDNITIGYDNTLLEGNEKVYIWKNRLSKKIQFEISASKSLFSVSGIFGEKCEISSLFVAMEHSGIVIERELFVAVYPACLKNIALPKSIVERKKEALKIVSKYADNNINKAIAILETEQKFTDKARECYLASLDYIKEKRDCADFYLPVMLRMLTRYRSYMTKENVEEFKSSLLNFRYWIDEKGNDVMWYFSENHAFLFHVSQYLTGNLFKEEIFVASGRTGQEQYVLGKERLSKWFEMFFKFGYAEWNSITYIPIDLIGFFALYDMAPDSEIRDMAKKALDESFIILANNNFNGIVSASYGRAYEDSVKFKELSETCFVEWITSGKGFVNSRSASISSYAISSYEPENFYKQAEIGENEAKIIKILQGANRIQTYNYMTRDFCISSVVNYRPFEKGHQQHLQNVSLGTSNVQFFINHPGESVFSGKSRPSYWAGNGYMPLIHQFRDLQMIKYRIKNDALVNYIHAYAVMQNFDEHKVNGNWFFARVDTAFIGVYFSNGFEFTKSGANTNKEIISYGMNHKLIIRCGNKKYFANFNEFCHRLSIARLDLNKENFFFSDPVYGDFAIKENKFTFYGKELDYKMTESYQIEKV